MENLYQLKVEEGGIRLDLYVSTKCPGLSRSQARKLIDNANVKVNGATARPALKLREGDSVDVSVPPPPPSTLSPEDIPVRILYEDEDLLVVDKPPGLTVHPAAGHRSHTLVNALLAHLKDVASGENERPGIVHRLDKDTSGLILVARNTAAHMNLAEQFKKHAITKVYIALVHGRLTPEEGIIEADIGRDPRDRKRMAVVSRGREARTEYKVLRYIQNYTLVEVRPRTGRTHQIRVHLAAIGFPVAGDATYGARSPFLNRQFLHACKLRFRLPSSGEWKEFVSELPADLSEALENIAGKD
ncbi:MAG: RluA family pseudouridine synthase [Dehalococcoidales bacterium]|nr:RluA family pseudouridine synthase [Dehalococcoidales bacterium]